MAIHVWQWSSKIYKVNCNSRVVPTFVVHIQVDIPYESFVLRDRVIVEVHHDHTHFVLGRFILQRDLEVRTHVNKYLGKFMYVQSVATNRQIDLYSIS